MRRNFTVISMILVYVSLFVSPGSVESRDVFPLIGDKDWNFWKNAPHLFTIPLGNVGIGTYNPVEKLHVLGNGMIENAGDSSVTIMSHHGESSLALLSWNKGNTAVDFVSSSTMENSWSIYRDGWSQNLTIEETPPFPVIGTHKWIIQNGTGRLGCNTEYPETMLDLRTPNGGYDGLGIRLDPHNGTMSGGTAWQIENHSADFRVTEHKALPGYPETRLTIASDTGNVGLGVGSPQSRLHVNGAINLMPVFEPVTPAAGFVLYVDHMDDKLKAKSAWGTVTIIADP